MDTVAALSIRLKSQSKGAGSLPAPTHNTDHLAAFCAPDCPVCGGVGFIRQDLPIGDPNHGKIQFCPNRRLPVSLERSGLFEEDRDLSWDAVRDENNALQAVRAIRETLAAGSGWVYLWGDYGLAKTLILRIAVAESLRSGVQGCYTRMVDLMDNLRSAYDANNPGIEAERRVEYWSSVPVLSLDEFDRVKETDWVRERRAPIMDERWEQAVRGKSVTLLASNAEPRSFAEGYLASRIYDNHFRVIRMTGVDGRI